MGWVNSRRDLGNLIFIDLRDREGITQIVFDPNVDEESHAKARVLRGEWVLAVKGTVSPRLEGQENLKLPTGAIELKVTGLKILNKSETPRFRWMGRWMLLRRSVSNTGIWSFDEENYSRIFSSAIA